MRSTFVTLVFVPCILAGQDQQPLYTAFPPDQTNMAQHGHQIAGCGCVPAIYVDPVKIDTPPNTKVTIRYDASTLCNGQCYMDMDNHPHGTEEFGSRDGSVGTVDWETGLHQSLPEIYGIVTLPNGYDQVGTNHPVRIVVNVQCYDNAVDRKAKPSRPCSTSCKAEVTIPVTVSNIAEQNLMHNDPAKFAREHNINKGDAKDQESPVPAMCPAFKPPKSE